MSSYARHTRRGAKARRTTNKPTSRMASSETQQNYRHNANQDPGSPKKGSQSHNTLTRKDITWADAARVPPGNNKSVARLPTYHKVAKDQGFPYPFAKNPHLLLTGRYSGSQDNSNELVFRHFFPSGQSATRELLQRYRTEAHAAIRNRIGVNLFHTDNLGDTITVVTKKQHGEWITTGDIRVRFPSATAAGSTYEQQRSQHHNRNTQADRLLGHTWQVFPTLIPTRHTGETAYDDSLHKAFVSCANFRGKDINSLLQLFRDSLQELYDKQYDIDAEHISHLEDFYTALSEAT